ncbi:YrdB family protein [Lentiprolixibacter aurantiacus]|uniref:YrdB family protein n=1 Tax=Lentiprolixibacter aurantiacus TaxID=2993939 RepID=A0AAE3SML9_9FLAO|nr:YrdB family protein [Lentiprolixibacter aurantiacus]MCX2718590.1 YrdB family protein [Lentiprolixibacter aurantiacus]
MASHPLNLMLRFLLEIAAIAAVGIWGWKLGVSWDRFLWALLLPVFLMTVWGVFAVPEDPSRSGNAPVPVAGWLRMLLELGVFTSATWVLYDLGFLLSSMIFAGICLLHYITSYDRVIWLLKR